MINFRVDFRNQEELEKVKKEIEDHKKRKRDYDREAAHTNTVLQSIKDALVEMLLKLQEVDEMTVEIHSKKKPMKPSSLPLPDLISGNISSEQLVRMLEEKVKFGMIAAGQLADNIDSGLSDEEIDDGESKPLTTATEQVIKSEDKIKTPSVASFAMMDEKPPSYPQVYSSLITGRSTGLISASPGGGPGAGSEEEADVPSRSFLKRQANLILDAKSRRKYRPAARRK